MYIKKVKVEMLHMAAYNPRKDLKPGDPDYEKLRRSIESFGYVDPIIWNERTGNVVGGHQRLKVLLEQGKNEIEVSVVNLSEAEEKTLNIALNKISGDWDNEKLEAILEELAADAEIDELLTGFDAEEIDDIINSLDEGEYFRDKLKESEHSTLFETFIVPPFSVFDTKQGYWQERKKYWTDLGIKGEVGRKENLTYSKNLNLSKNVKGTSIFDPVVCEIVYRWFCPPEGKIMDPFAGGPVRGIVAALTGHQYLGIDLRDEQIRSNRENAEDMSIPKSQLSWICDDSKNIDKHVEDKSFDMLFTCPPYFDLEVYSENKADLSNMSNEDFIEAYTQILSKAAAKVKDNRFAVIVVSDEREKEGYYRKLHELTKDIMHKAGFRLYNEIILLNTVGSGAWRVRGYMKSRKVVRIHQNVLVFYKGSTKKIGDIFPELKEEEKELEDMDISEDCC